MFELDSPAKYLLCSQQTPEHYGVPSTGNITYGYPSTCYPSAMAADSDGGLLRLARGQQAEIDISITRHRFHRVSISESSPEGQRQGLSFYNLNGANVNGSVRWNDEGRSWEAWLPNGTYYAESHSWAPHQGMAVWTSKSPMRL